MRKVCLVLAFLLAVAVGASAQDVPKAEVFAGYSYARVNPGGGADGFNLNGWNASVTGNFNSWFGIKADLSGHYGTPTVNNILPPPATLDVDTNTFTYLFGPQISARGERVTGFAHALFGGARVEGSTLGASISDSGFGMALGGGFDVKLNDNFAFRPAQLDYLLTRIGGDTQHNVRYSAGIVFRFGK
jgi:opacity protein-like surface antigen